MRRLLWGGRGDSVSAFDLERAQPTACVRPPEQGAAGPDRLPFLGLDAGMTARADGPSGSRTLAELGEFPVIAAITERFGTGDRVLLGPGDDAAVVRVDGGRVVVSTDVLVDVRHFRRDWASAVDICHRAAAQSLSDLNAMGATATAVTVGLAAPGHLEVSWVLGLADGLAAECDLVGASVVGGDLTRCDLLMISVTALGR